MTLEIRFKPIGIVFLLGFIVAAIVFGIVGWTRPGGVEAKKREGNGEIILLANSATEGWLQEQTDRFNAAYRGRIHVSLRVAESHRAMNSILTSPEKPSLWASSPLWTQHLNTAWASNHGGKSLITTENNDTYRTYLRSPLVFVTMRKKASYLQPLLGNRGAWLALRELSMGRRTPPWGSFKFAYADPLVTDTGFMTLGMIVSEYSARNRSVSKLDDLSQNPRFLQYLGEVDRRLVCDEITHRSSAAMLETFRTFPNRYDVVTAMENEAIDALATQPDLVVIYPDPTCIVEQRVTLLDGADWLTDEQKAAARTFLTFLSDPESERSSLKNHFRLTAPSREMHIDNALSPFGERGFQQSVASVDLPPFRAIQFAAEGWYKVTPGAEINRTLTGITDTPDSP